MPSAVSLTCLLALVVCVPWIIFIVFIPLKVDNSVDFSWICVFGPCFAGIIIVFLAILLQIYFTEFRSAFSNLSQISSIISVCGALATAILLSIRLDNQVSFNIIYCMLPLLIAFGITWFIDLVKPNDPTRPPQDSKTWCPNWFLFALQIILIAEKIDGNLLSGDGGSWWLVFLPSWVCVASLSIIPCVMCCVKQGVAAIIALLLLGPFIAFFALLCSKLQSGTVSATSVCIPLWILFGLLLLLNAVVMVVFWNVREVASDDAEDGDMQSQLNNPTGFLQKKAVPKFLVRVSDTYFKEAEVKEAAGRPSESSDIESGANEIKPINVGLSPPNYQATDEDVPPLARGISATGELTTTMCIICLEKERDSVFLRCGHAVCCYDCGKIVTSKPNAKCPMCRSRIEQLVKIEDKGGKTVAVVRTPSIRIEGDPEPESEGGNSEHAVPAVAPSSNSDEIEM